MLHYSGVGDPGDRDNLVVLFHGYAQNEQYFDAALARFRQENTTYISVRAPRSLGRASYFWFPLITSPQFSMDPVIEVSDQVITWLEDQREHYRRIILAGFSQGTEVTSTIFRHRPDLVDGLVFLSGIIIDEDHTYFRDSVVTGRSTPAFFGVDPHDGVLPKSLLGSSERWLEQHMRVSLHRYPGMGHRISNTEADDVARYLSQVTGTDRK